MIVYTSDVTVLQGKWLCVYIFSGFGFYFKKDFLEMTACFVH